MNQNLREHFQRHESSKQDMNTVGLLESMWHDLRYAARGFRKSPGYTSVALLSLALGIGANTAIFSVVYGVLIDPYPYAKPNEIWAPQIRSLKTQQGRGLNFMSEFPELAKLPAVADVMATSQDNMLLTGDHAPESLQGVLLTGNALHFLGVSPMLGRPIVESDIRPSGEAEPVVVLSYGAWQRLFNGDPNAIGKVLVLNDVPHTVIGVMPSRFGWFTNTGVWVPLPKNPRDRMVSAIMRLRPDVSKRVAEDQLHALYLRLARETPANFPKDGFRTSLVNYMDITVASGEMRSSLQLLFGVVGFLLLIACANVANLQLARATARAREIAVRMSIGAGRIRVLRQLLTESVLLSVVGGAIGVLFAIAATKVIVAIMPEFYVPNEARITVNSQVLLFSVAVSVLTGILFGLAPALQCSRADLTDALKDAARGSGVSEGSRRTRNLLVVVEVALSVILLVGASLTIRSFAALHQVDTGFQADRVLMVGLPLPPKRYATLEQRNTFAATLMDRVKSLPGVEAVAMGNGGMPFGGPRSPYSIEGRPQADSQRLVIGLISADYLRTMGIPLRRGRALTEQEIAHGDHVVLLNEAASKLWPAGESPIGKHMRIDLLEKPGGSQVLAPSGSTGLVTVAGIIGDTKNNGIVDPPAPAAFVPYTLLAPPQRALAVRTQGDPMLLLNAVREQVRAMDKEQPLSRPITMQEVLGFQTVQPRFNTALFAFFAMLGLTLAMAGIYSVLSYHATRRTHEIGIRMALGAQRGDVLSLMFAMGAKLVLVGLAAGLLGSFFLTRFLRNQLFHVSTMDPVSIVAVVLLLSCTAFSACYIPARRAARLDPMSALRHE
jgi:putative ABC transport system permease protein